MNDILNKINHQHRKSLEKLSERMNRMIVNKLPVFYRPEMVAFQPHHASPSSFKPKEVVDDWEKLKFPIEIKSFDPVTREDYYFFHNIDHVNDILDCKKPNGFSNTSEDVAKSLPYTAGSIVAAALEVMQTGKVACSPTSGFHHAGYNKSEGFCTFNGLMVAADKVWSTYGWDKKIGIFDLDHHYGNGTDDIIGRFHLDNVVHYTIGGADIFGPDKDNVKRSEEFINILPQICHSFDECDLILYQAGADLWVEDPYAWYGGLTLEQLKERDRIIFSYFAAKGIPLVWNLAGGYKQDEHGSLEPVLSIHRNTMLECMSAYFGD